MRVSRRFAATSLVLVLMSVGAAWAAARPASEPARPSPVTRVTRFFPEASFDCADACQWRPATFTFETPTSSSVFSFTITTSFTYRTTPGVLRPEVSVSIRPHGAPITHTLNLDPAWGRRVLPSILPMSITTMFTGSGLLAGKAYDVVIEPNFSGNSPLISSMFLKGLVVTVDQTTA